MQGSQGGPTGTSHSESSILAAYLMSILAGTAFPPRSLISINNQGLESEFILSEEENTGYKSNTRK